MERHWHLYRWDGRTRPEESLRIDPTQPYPPLEIAHWLRKHRSRVEATVDMDGAEEWMAAQLEENPPLPGYTPSDSGHLNWVERLRPRMSEHPGDVVWGYYTRSGGYASRVAIACPKVGEKCPDPPD